MIELMAGGPMITLAALTAGIGVWESNFGLARHIGSRMVELWGVKLSPALETPSLDEIMPREWKASFAVAMESIKIVGEISGDKSPVHFSGNDVIAHGILTDYAAFLGNGGFGDSGRYQVKVSYLEKVRLGDVVCINYKRGGYYEVKKGCPLVEGVATVNGMPVAKISYFLGKGVDSGIDVLERGAYNRNDQLDPSYLFSGLRKGMWAEDKKKYTPEHDQLLGQLGEILGVNSLSMDGNMAEPFIAGVASRMLAENFLQPVIYVGKEHTIYGSIGPGDVVRTTLGISELKMNKGIVILQGASVAEDGRPIANLKEVIKLAA